MDGEGSSVFSKDKQFPYSRKRNQRRFPLSSAIEVYGRLHLFLQQQTGNRNPDILQTWKKSFSGVPLEKPVILREGESMWYHQCCPNIYASVRCCG